MVKLFLHSGFRFYVKFAIKSISSFNFSLFIVSKIKKTACPNSSSPGFFHVFQKFYHYFVANKKNFDTCFFYVIFDEESIATGILVQNGHFITFSAIFVFLHGDFRSYFRSGGKGLGLGQIYHTALKRRGFKLSFDPP